MRHLLLLLLWAGLFGLPVSDFPAGEPGEPCRTVRFPGAAISASPPPTGKVARVRTDQAIFRTGPGDRNDRLHPLTAGLTAPVFERRGDWLRLWPGKGWVHRDDVVLEDRPCPQPALSSIRVLEPSRGGAELRLQLDRPTAWQVTLLSPQQLCLSLPGTALHEGTIRYSVGPRRVRSVEPRLGAEGALVDVRTHRPVWGWDLRWEPPELVLELAEPPRIDSERPLRDVHVVIDPGHGGVDAGAVGWGGLTEKELNLTVARAMKAELEDAGARVTLTRDGDFDVAGGETGPVRELAARVAVGEEAGGHVFLSLHHESVGDSWATGTRVYYYHTPSRRLAEALTPALAGAIKEPNHLFARRSFAVTRQTRMPSVLVEANFLSNPDQEHRMRRPDYARKAARGVRQGLEVFFNPSDASGAPRSRR